MQQNVVQEGKYERTKRTLEIGKRDDTQAWHLEADADAACASGQDRLLPHRHTIAVR